MSGYETCTQSLAIHCVTHARTHTGTIRRFLENFGDEIDLIVFVPLDNASEVSACMFVCTTILQREHSGWFVTVRVDLNIS